MAFSLFERIKQKALQAVQPVVDYFNPTSNAGQNFWSTPTAQRLADIQQRYEQRGGIRQFSLPHAMASGQLTTGIKPVDLLGQIVGSYMRNAWVEPALQIPSNVEQIIKGKTALEKAKGAGKLTLNTLSAIPDPFEIPLAAINIAKGASAARLRGERGTDVLKSAIKSATWEETPGLGEALTTSPTGQMVGNIAELPLLLMAGFTRTKKNKEVIDSVIKSSKSPVEAADKVDTMMNAVYQSFNRLLKEKPEEAVKRLKATRASLNQYVDNVVGTTSGSWKLDYYVKKALLEDPDNLHLARMVNHIENIDDILSNVGKKAKETPVKTNEPSVDEIMSWLRKIASDETSTAVKGTKEVGPEAGKIKIKGLKEIATKQEALPNILPTPTTPKGAVEEVASPELDILKMAKKVGGADLNTKGLWYKKRFYQMREALQSLFGKVYEKGPGKLLERHVERIDKADKWGNSFIDRLGKVAEENNLKRNSTDDKLLHLLRKDGGYEKLVKLVGEERAKQLSNVYSELRNIYKSILNDVNKRRIEVGLPKIKEKKDFLSQISKNTGSFFDIFNQPAEVISGPVSSPIFKRQKSQPRVGALESFMNYIDYAKRAGFYDISGAEIQAFRKELAKNKKTPLQALQFLKEWESSITGEGKEITSLEKGLSKYMRTRRTAAVVLKIGPLINQWLSTVPGVANSGIRNFVKGNLDKNTERLAKESKLLAYLEPKTPNKYLRRGGLNNVVDWGADVLQQVNHVIYKTIWKGMVEKAKKMGVKDVVKWADNETARVLGDRRPGTMPLIFTGTSRNILERLAAQVFTPFTVEPLAQSTSLMQNIGSKQFGTVLGTVLSMYLANNLYEKFFRSGIRPYPDIIQGVKEALERWGGSDTKDENKIKAMTAVATEIVQTFNPILSNAIFGFYDIGETAGLLPEGRDVFVQDPTWMGAGGLANPLAGVSVDKETGQIRGRNITGKPIVDVPLTLASNYVPGVSQLTSSLQDLISQQRGYAETKTGRAAFVMPSDPYNVVRGLLLGQSSLPQSKEVYGSDFKRPLSPSETEVVRSLPKEQAQAFIKSVQEAQVPALKAESKIKKLKTGELSWFDKLLGKKETFNWDSVPKTKAEKDAYTKAFNKVLEAETTSGQDILPSIAYKNGLFGGKDLQSTTTYSERSELLRKALDFYKDENYSPTQKQKMLDALGLSEDQMKYYWLTSLNPLDRRAGLEKFVSENADNRDLVILGLALNKRTINGNAVAGSQDFDYLYDMGLISKSEKKLLNSLRFDEASQKFYFDRDFVSSGGLTPSKRRSILTQLTNITLRTWKATTTSKKPIQALFAKKPVVKAGKEKILKKEATRRKGKWFKGY